MPAAAQSIEPRFYSNTPVGVNFVIAGVAYTRGGLAFDSSLRVTEPQLKTWNPVVAYARSFGILGMSAKFDASVPYTWLSGSALYRGDAITRDVNGGGDPLLRMSVNFYGAPALTLPEFRTYRQDLIVGASLQVSVPVGQYDDTRVVNAGVHRWFVKPEVGVSQALGRWTVEAKGAVTLFSTNHDFYNGNTRAQAPLYSVQANAIHNFESGIWASIDATYFMGGRTTLNGETNADLQQNWRAGGTLALPITPPTRSSCTQARGCRHAPATATTSSASPGSIAGAAACSGAGVLGRPPERRYFGWLVAVGLDEVVDDVRHVGVVDRSVEHDLHALDHRFPVGAWRRRRLIQHVLRRVAHDAVLAAPWRSRAANSPSAAPRRAAV